MDLTHAASGIPRTGRRHLSRPRLLDRLDEADRGQLVILRGVGGAGKTALLAEWLRAADRVGDVAWVSLDETTSTRASFWLRAVRIMMDRGIVDPTGPLSEFVVGYSELDLVPARLLDELVTRRTPAYLVIDDFHLAKDAALADELVWLLIRSPMLHLLVTTRAQGGLEASRTAALLEPTVLDGDELAFTVAETVEILTATAQGISIATASIVRESTGGNPLATRVAITAIEAESDGHRLTADRVLAAVGDDITRQLLPAFKNERQRDVALAVAIAPTVDRALARQLSGQPDAWDILRRFETDGIGDIRGSGESQAFTFHALVAAALIREAERAVDHESIRARRQTAAAYLADRGQPIAALRLFAQLGEFDEMWPVIGRNYSDLINHQQQELLDVIAIATPAELAAHPTLAIAQAIVLSESQSHPSMNLLGMVTTAVDLLGASPLPEGRVERFYVLAALLGGARAARRYDAAGPAARQLAAHVATMSAAELRAAGHSIGAALIQIAFTHVLLGRFEEAAAVTDRLQDDPHPTRAQHRLSLLAFMHALDGNMPEAETILRMIEPANSAHWRATLPATGWHMARTLALLEAGDTGGALTAITELDASIGDRELWPYALWVKAQTRLLGSQPEVGLDELTAALRANRGRPASAFAHDLLAAIRSDLHLASGQPDGARRVLRARPATATAPVRLARVRLDQIDGLLDKAKIRVGRVLGQESLTTRHRIDALIQAAVIDLRLGLEADAAIATRRAFALVSRYGISTPLLNVSRNDLDELLAVAGELRLPDRIASGPDPFAGATAHLVLTARERELLDSLDLAPTIRSLAAVHHLSPNTVKTHLQHIYRKLGVSTRAEALAVARRHHLLSVDGD